MLRRPLTLLALCALLAGCPEDANQASADAGAIAASDAGASASVADDFLRSSNLRAAHDAYEAALAASPADSHAAFGAALTSLLLLPESQAVSDLLAQCGEQPLSFSTQVFGAGGLLSLDRDARRGSGTIDLSTRQGPSGEWTKTAFQAESFRTTAQTVSAPGQSDRLLRIEVKDFAFAGRQTAQLVLTVSYSNAALWGLPVQPLADGLVVPAEQFGGTLQVLLPSADGLVWDSYTQPVSGNLVFTKVGTGATGDAISVELVNLEVEGLPRSCAGTCGPEAWPYLLLDGTLSDNVSAQAQLTLPFAGLGEDAGPPHRERLVVLLDRCPDLSAETLRAALGGVLDGLEEVAGQLGVVLADADAEVFQFQVPGGLFFVDGSIPLNITDARVLRAGVALLLGLGRGASEYRTLARRFDELIGEYQLWVDSLDGPVTRAERGFLVRELVAELNAVFLDRQPGFDLSKASAFLSAALADASLALTREPKNSGVLDFQEPNAKSFAADLNAQVELFETSLIKPGLQSFPHSPAYRLALHDFFASPLDLAALRQASTSGAGLFLLEEGDPLAPWADGRNDRLALDEAGLAAACAPYLQLPADLSDLACDEANPCPSQYTCVSDLDLRGLGGHCTKPAFQLLDPDALQRAIPASGDPAFVDTKALLPLSALF